MVNKLTIPGSLVLCCDWGTSSFRMRLVDSSSFNIISELTNSDGIADVFNQWLKDTSADRVSFFAGYLQKAVKKLEGATSLSLSQLPLVISGMASSSIGIKELPYAEMPFAVDGSDAKTEWLSDKGSLTNPLLLISGIRHSSDVVRGEETEFIGVAALIERKDDESIFIFPGTHSKHLMVKAGSVVSSETFLTGELFALMRQQSVLSHSVSVPKQSMLYENTLMAFKEGVMQASRYPLLSALFTTRVNGIDNRFSKELNYYYLSGLLIGSELNELQKRNSKVILCCGGKLKPFYETALEQIIDAERLQILPSAIMNKAVVAGQVKILDNKINNNE